MILNRTFLTLIILVTTHTAYTQIKISGSFLDSATLHPVGFVQIQARTKGIGTADADGFFSIVCSPGDTLQFSRIGYKTATKSVMTEDLHLVILLTEFTTQLNSVTIFGSYKPQGYSQWFENTKPRRFQNPNALENFGFAIPGPISYFTKYERERRKLRKLKTDHLATAVFRSVIASEEVKAHFMKLFELTEEQYFLKIEAFNVEFPEAQYIKEKDDIVDLLTYFFARKEK